jgi:hypothetical protein
MDMSANKKGQENRRGFAIAGSILILTGIIIILSLQLDIPYVALGVVPAIGGVVLGIGIRKKRIAAIIAGSITLLCGLVGYSLIIGLINLTWNEALGAFIIALAISWLIVALGSTPILGKPLLWPIIPAIILGSLGSIFVFTKMTLLDFVFFLCVGIGLALWGAGIHAKLIGLIIPGSILLGVGPGVYFAWANQNNADTLSQVGLMLVCFAFGWALITISSRAITSQFVWWPLIPGGVLAFTGWGLYIGGNSQDAVGFVANTGSISLIIIGVYLLMLRRGMQK